MYQVTSGHFRILNLREEKGGRKRKEGQTGEGRRGRGETFWEVSISFTKLPEVHSRKKVKTTFIWHVPDRGYSTGHVLERRPKDTEQ